MASQVAYQYVVLRCVPRADREEFLNVGVVLHCQAYDFLAVRSGFRAERLLAVDPGLDTDQITSGLDFVAAVCAGEPRGGSAAAQPLGTRFGFLKAPRSTVLQPGPVHGGLTDDPQACLDRLFDRLVG